MTVAPVFAPSVKRLQLAVATGLLTVMGLSGVSLDLVARNQRLADWVDRKEKEFAEVSRTSFTRDGYYIDDNDRLLLEELPAADYSRGGVYLLGSSTVRAATKFWELPPAQRALIHNYGISQSDYTCHLQFLRHLVEDDGLLRAGGDKSLVIFAESYHTLSRRYEPDGFFVNLWKRHGLYDCNREQGIRPRPVNSVWRALHLERNRMAGCLNRLDEVAHLEVRRAIHGNELARKPDAATVNQLWRERMGPDWQQKIAEGIADFNEVADYLQARQVHVLVVLLPVGSPEDKLPFERTYIVAMTAACQAKGIELRDWSRRLPDEDLQDTSHSNVYGADKLQPAFLEIGLRFLQATHALPGTGAETKLVGNEPAGN